MVMRSQGPDNTTLSVDGFYYHRKLDHLERITRWMNCDPSPAPYHTHMDGEEGWACQAGDIFCTNKSEFVNTLHSGCKVLTLAQVWGGCDGGNEVVQCQAERLI